MSERTIGWVAVAFGWAMLLAGCSKSPEQLPMPETATARQALDTALSAWKSGQTRPGKLTLGETGIEVRDAIWNSGERLMSYEIGAEESRGASRWFSVKLTLPRGQQTVKYIVVGRDPMWVYTEEEFGILSAWGDDPLRPPPRPVTYPGRPSGSR